MLTFKEFVAEEGEGSGVASGASSAPANVAGSGVSTDISVPKSGDIKKYLFRRPKMDDKFVKNAQTKEAVQWSGSTKAGVGPAEG